MTSVLCFIYYRNFIKKSKWGQQPNGLRSEPQANEEGAKPPNNTDLTIYPT